MATPPSISSARIKWRTTVPVHKWRWQSLIQSFCWAKDPNTGREFLFVGQARRGGVGEIEDLFIHRHELKKDWSVVYLDTMTCDNFGHAQSMHVRISAAGNAWVWSGVEQYTSSGRHTSTKVARYRYRAGARITKSSSDFAYIKGLTGNTLAAVSCEPWKIVIRRAKSLTDEYTEYLEEDLVKGVAKPLRRLTRLKTRPGPYQGSCADRFGVHVVGGATESSHKMWQYRWPAAGKTSALSTTVRAAGTKTITGLKAPAGPNTSSEPECVGFIRGILHVGKRFNSVERRRYDLFSVEW